MKKRLGIPPISQTDRLLALAFVGCFLAAHLIVGAMDEAAIRSAEEDNPQTSEAQQLPLQVDTLVFYGKTPNAALLPPSADDDPLNAENLTQTASYDEAIPLSRELQEALREACEEHNVPLCLALGLIEVESSFDPDANNGVSVGLMQLNTRYYPSDLTPEENIRAGVAHLAWQIERYGGDIQAALRAYNRGFDDGDRQYSSAVLNASEKWGCG